MDFGDHANAFDPGVALRSPAGTESIVNPPLNALLNHYPGLHRRHLLSNAFNGENPNWTWTVDVADGAAGDTGELSAARLRLDSGEHGPDSN